MLIEHTMLEAEDNLRMNTPHLDITLLTDSWIYKDMYTLTSDEGMYCTTRKKALRCS